MINFNDYANENKTGSGKINALLNLINNHPDIDKYIYMLKICMKLNINFELIQKKAQD